MQTNDEILWTSETCEPYREWVAVPLSQDGVKPLSNPNLIDDIVFWRCNASYEIGTHHYFETVNVDLLNQNTLLAQEASAYHDEVQEYIFSSMLFIFGCFIVIWYLAHKRRVRSFQAHHLDRLARESHMHNRDAVAQVRALIEREVEDSKHLLPYIFGVREQYKPTLADTANTAIEVQQAVNAYLEPRSQIELERQRMKLALRRRGEEIKQDLQAEVPRFVREQLRRQHQEEQSRWRATTQEVTELRKTLIATVTELRENPALQTKLEVVLDSVNNLTDTMTRLRNEGRVDDDSIGEYLDRIITKVTEDHIAKSTGSTFNVN